MENVTPIVSYGSIVMKILSGCCAIICFILIVIIIIKNIKMKDISKNEKMKKLSPYITSLIGFLILMVMFYIFSKPYVPSVEISYIYHKLWF